MPSAKLSAAFILISRRFAMRFNGTILSRSRARSESGVSNSWELNSGVRARLIDQSSAYFGQLEQKSCSVDYK